MQASASQHGRSRCLAADAVELESTHERCSADREAAPRGTISLEHLISSALYEAPSASEDEQGEHPLATLLQLTTIVGTLLPRADSVGEASSHHRERIYLALGLSAALHRRTAVDSS